MREPVKIAVETYIRAWGEGDPAVRATMIEACFAADGRIVAHGWEIRGRAALVDAIGRLLDDPQFRRIRVLSAIDASGTTFRFRAAVERRDGTTHESLDAGEIDADGRISLLLTFAEPLGEADERTNAASDT
jgi:hypothetical protein